MRTVQWQLGLLVLALVLWGCGGPPVEDTVTVKGKVTQGGQPVPGPTKEQITPTPEAPPELPAEYFAVTFTKLGEGDQQLAYGEAIVLQGGVFEHQVPPGRYRLEVHKRRGGPGGAAMGGIGEGGGTPTGSEGQEGAPLVTQEVEITQEGQEITLEIPAGGGGQK